MPLDEIVSSGLCIGCGLCQSVAGPSRVRLIATADGVERPVAREPLDRATLREINAVCPGTRVGGSERERTAAGAITDPIWGPAARLAIAHAADPEVRFRSSSGGVLTALAGLMLERGEIDFVVHVGPAPGRPLRSARQISVDRAALLRAAASRYGPAAALIDFCELLERGRPFALVGKPCDVSAVRNLARRDARVDRHLRATLAMICGGASRLTKSTDVLERFGVSEPELESFRYRGEGAPGLTRLTTVDGRTHAITYGEMWADEQRWELQSRCKICPDAIGESADVVAGDCWDGGDPGGEDDGFNAVLARTSRGVRLFDDAVAAGRIVLDREMSFRDLDRFQPHQVAKKRAVWARMLGLRAAGGRAPAVSGLRIGRLALGRSPRGTVAEARATARRLRGGRFGEPAPRVQAAVAELPWGD